MQHYKVFIRLWFDIKQKLIIGLATFIRLCQWINIKGCTNCNHNKTNGAEFLDDRSSVRLAVKVPSVKIKSHVKGDSN